MLSLLVTQTHICVTRELSINPKHYLIRSTKWITIPEKHIYIKRLG